MAHGTAITVVNSTRAGVALPDTTAAASQMSFINDDERELLIIKNGSASPITVTIPIPVTVDGKAVASLTVSVAAGAEKVIGPFPKAVYNQSDGLVYADFSGTTSVTVGVLQCGSVAF